MGGVEYHVKKCIAKIASLPEKEIVLEKPKQASFGDYAFPCFMLAKQLKKSPQQIAVDLAGQLKTQKIVAIEKVEPVGPYLNIFINRQEFAEEVLSALTTKKNDYGRGKRQKERGMVEYSQVNTHKAFHVGHLRGTLLGASIINLL